jgi:hypothetical protein
MLSWQSKSKINIPIMTDMKDSITLSIACEVLCIPTVKPKSKRKYEKLTKWNCQNKRYSIEIYTRVCPSKKWRNYHSMSTFDWTNLLGISDTRNIPCSVLLLIAYGTCGLTWNNIGVVKKGKQNEMVPDVLGKSKGIAVASLVWTRVTQKMCSPHPTSGKIWRTNRRERNLLLQ